MNRRKRKNSHKLSRKRWVKWRVLSMGLYGKRQDHPAWKSYRSYLAYNNRYFKEDALPGSRFTFELWPDLCIRWTPVFWPFKLT